VTVPYYALVETKVGRGTMVGAIHTGANQQTLYSVQYNSVEIDEGYRTGAKYTYIKHYEEEITVLDDNPNRLFNAPRKSRDVDWVAGLEEFDENDK
jgi:hypothetical protein